MTRDDLVNALQVAIPTQDSKGRSRYGMGLKTAACWIGKSWCVTTAELTSGEEWTAEVHVASLMGGNMKIPLRKRDVDRSLHYTKIIISDLNRYIQNRTEDNIKNYLGSMYRFDINSGQLKLTWNGTEIKPPEEVEFDVDPEGHPYKREIPPTDINGKTITGWIGVLKKGGRKYGGFSLFQNKRQIQGFPTAWKPRSIFGGENEEGANNLIAQRLTGILELEGFEVSHTKDTILWQADDEEKLEDFLVKFCDEYRKRAQSRRGKERKKRNREELKELLKDLSKEFTSDEMKDTIEGLYLPPTKTIEENNTKEIEALSSDDIVAEYKILDDLRVVLSYLARSENDPYVVIQSGADGALHVIINEIHPYYEQLETDEIEKECVRQFVFDAVADYRVSKLGRQKDVTSVRRAKDTLLRVGDMRAETLAEGERERELAALNGSSDSAE
jgi:hypothetical protein